MTQEPKIGTCSNCHEKECEELFEVETDKGKQEWCCDCISGKLIEEQENGNK